MYFSSLLLLATSFAPHTCIHTLSRACILACWNISVHAHMYVHRHMLKHTHHSVVLHSVAHPVTYTCECSYTHNTVICYKSHHLYMWMQLNVRHNDFLHILSPAYVDTWMYDTVISYTSCHLHMWMQLNQRPQFIQAVLPLVQVNPLGTS